MAKLDAGAICTTLQCMALRKSEVYSWRLDPDLKSRLEQRARDEGIGLAALLERISRDWLRAKVAASGDDERAQARIKAAAMRAIGSLRGDDPERSERVRERVRARLVQKRAR
jgi:hypothetical protein